MPDTPIADRIVQAAADHLGPAAFAALGSVAGSRYLASQITASVLRELVLIAHSSHGSISLGDLTVLMERIEQQGGRDGK